MNTYVQHIHVCTLNPFFFLNFDNDSRLMKFEEQQWKLIICQLSWFISMYMEVL